MDDIWFEDELVPIEDQQTESTRGTSKGEYDDTGVKAVIRIARPSWREVKFADFPIKGKHWLLRMRVEFETLHPRVEFLFAHCQAYIEKLFPKDPDDPQIVEIFPTNLMNQEPKNIRVKLEPSIKFSFAELSAGASIGEISKEIAIGRVSSETIGYIGDQQRNPHWKLNPGKYEIDGLRDFFMLIEQPPRCQKVTIRIRVEAKIKNHKGIFYMGPRDEPKDGPKIWSQRPRIIIE